MWALRNSLPHHTQQFSILLFPATGSPIFGNRTTPAGVVPTLQWMGSGRRPASRPASPSPLPLRAGGLLRRSAAKSRDFAASSCSSFDFPSTLKIQMDPIGELGGSLGWAVWAGRTGDRRTSSPPPAPLGRPAPSSSQSARRGFDSGGWHMGLDGAWLGASCSRGLI